MGKKTKERPSDSSAEEEVFEDEEETPKRKSPPRGHQPPRLSITVPPSTRKKIRLAAALRDMDDAEWCRVVLVTASKRTVEKNFPGLMT